MDPVNPCVTEGPNGRVNESIDSKIDWERKGRVCPINRWMSGVCLLFTLLTDGLAPLLPRMFVELDISGHFLNGSLS